MQIPCQSVEFRKTTFLTFVVEKQHIFLYNLMRVEINEILQMFQLYSINVYRNLICSYKNSGTKCRD